ncbi:uncharacterized protein J3D65DRAFT_670505 [Phyllosticta citribraziliensis]|uniref:Uncharacterized protein n=1 Tax=Phyllosticta citribraziliensis TaxID=989973 RepID=A0ABR1LDI8_9PEZI
MAMARHYPLTALAWRRAPALVPRAATRLQFHTSHIAANDTGTSSAFLSKRRRVAKLDKRPGINIAQSEDIENFLSLAEKAKINAAKLQEVADQYPLMVEKGVVHQRMTNLLAEMLHTNFRNAHPGNKNLKHPPPFIFDFAQRLAEDMRAGRIWPSPVATLRLISLCKESKQPEKGKAYWAMLVDKEGAVDAGTYGSYIELLAEEGATPLAEMEALYQEALERFPGTFAAYHLSPNAILPDRKKAAWFTGMSAHLLQGITTARLVHGDWKNAYLALDTAFRVWATQVPARFLQLFRDHRPTPESYRIFMMACQGGCLVRPRDCVIQTSMVRDVLRDTSIADRGKVLLSTLDAFTAFVGAGGAPVHHFVTLLMKNLEGVVPSPYQREPGDQEIADLVARTGREIYEDFANAGLPPRMVTLASRIHLLGKTLNAQELGIAMKDAKHLRSVELGVTGSLERNVLLAAGKIKHRDLLVEAWKDLAATMVKPRSEDWHCLAVACRDADFKSFFTSEFASARDVKPHEHKAIMFQLDWEFQKSTGTKFKSMSVEATQELMDAVKSKVSAITGMLRANKGLDFNASPTPMDFDGVRVGTPEAMREVYDKLTTDPLAPAPVEDDGQKKTITMSSTGIPMEELRFRNWVGMTELLKHAELHEHYKVNYKVSNQNKSSVWVRPPPEAMKPIDDPAELLEEVKRLRGITEVPKAPDVFPSYEARREEVRRQHDHKL